MESAALLVCEVELQAVAQRPGGGMITLQMLSLWVAVFVGLDLAFDDGTITYAIEEALERAAERLRELLRW